ncbi:MAG: acyltransferase [Bacteroidales bacterium]|nr:acyltransferase [Bacteroidales bacterium]
MEYRKLSKDDTSILKGIGILCIIMHNFLHWANPLNGKENEFWFIPENIFSFFNAFKDYPADSFNIFFSYLGHFGVQIFIFISGYGLAMSMINNHKKYFQFIKDRLIKLYPLIIIAFVFHFMFTIIANYHVLEWKDFRSFIYKFLFIHTLIPNEGMSQNGPLWFLGLIFQLYLLFPLIFKLIHKYGFKAFVIICTVSYAITYSCIYTHILPEGIFIMQNFPGHLPEFALGIYIATSRNKCFNWIAFILAIIAFCAGNFYKAAYPLTFLSITYITICIYTMATKRGHINAFSKALMFVGNLSMVIFATHSQLRWPFVSITISANNPWYTLMLLAFFIIFAIIISLAAKVIYQWLVEKFSKVRLTKKRNIIPIICTIAFVSTSCNNHTPFNYPESKVWAHKVNDTTSALEKSKKFAGLELDAIYSDYQNKIFVGHDIEDTANNLQIEDWFNYVENPSQKGFWIDIKNLNRQNAEPISNKLLGIMDKHNMTDNLFVESPDVDALKAIKHYGLRVILWTENPVWDDIDTATWIERTKERINDLSPDAISNNADMYELLTENFPEQNIHIWQTPAKLNDENIEITRKICRNKSVKVVLVDYDEPIDY